MALYPRQNSNFCLQHCCFELSLDFTLQYSTSTIQHCPFTIQCPYFKCNVVRTGDILIQCSMCLYGVNCDMLAMQSNILVSCVLNQYPYFASKFLRLTCDIRVFQCNVDTRCVCCGAECDMPATQSNILLHARVNNHSHTCSQGGVDKTWARAHGLAHGLPYGLPYFDDLQSHTNFWRDF